MSEYRTEKALRHLLLVETKEAPVKVSVSPLAKQKANGKAILKPLVPSPEELEAELGEEKARLLAERREVEATRLMRQTGLTSRPLPKPTKSVLKLVDED